MSTELTIMEDDLERIEIAVRHGQQEVALGMLAKVRREAKALDALRATVDVALVELDDATDQEALLIFVERVRRGLDPDLDK